MPSETRPSLSEPSGTFTANNRAASHRSSAIASSPAMMPTPFHSDRPTVTPNPETCCQSRNEKMR